MPTGLPSSRHYTLVLGGGGIRGLAHVGVLAALNEAGFVPSDVVGSSVGAIVAAAWCAGMGIDEMRQLALDLKRHDLFQVAHREMAFKRMRSPGLYRREPIEHFVTGLLGDLTFEELAHPLLVNTVDINTGTQVLWGLPGLRDLPVADAVIASCALPGFLPPHRIGKRYYVDGAAVANLPVEVAARAGRDLVVGVDVSGRHGGPRGVHGEGFAAIYARATEIGMERMDEAALRHWERPPLVLLRPAVWHVPLLSFRHNDQLLDAGYEAAHDWLTRPAELPGAGASGVFPVHRHRVAVDRERCVGCGVCPTVEPAIFRMDGHGKAVVIEPEPLWSPVDGFVVRQCPVGAIAAEKLDA